MSKSKSICEYCINYEYDEDFEAYSCIMDPDEDEMRRFVYGNFRDCPYFRQGDEYTIVKKQA